MLGNFFCWHSTVERTRHIGSGENSGLVFLTNPRGVTLIELKIIAHMALGGRKKKGLTKAIARYMQRFAGTLRVSAIEQLCR